MEDIPGWIQLLYKRRRAQAMLHDAFSVNSANRHLEEQIEGCPEEREQLRDVALRCLSSVDAEEVAQSLVFLGVVGKREDIATIEGYLGDAAELVQRAARLCVFQIRQRESE